MFTKFQLVSAVLSDVARTGRPAVTRGAEVAALFGGTDEFLLAVHYRWSTAVTAHVDALLEDPPADLESAYADLCLDLAAKRPSLRALLDAYAANPAVLAAETALARRMRRDLGLERLDSAAGRQVA
jgi:hypothetical protein